MRRWTAPASGCTSRMRRRASSSILRPTIAPAEGPAGLAIDAANHRLFAGGGKKVVMIDNKTGKVLASAPICDGSDATAYDPGAKLVFVSCSDGKVTIAHVDGPDKLTVVQTLETAPGS